MSGKVVDLPNRFPVGTGFVIEGFGGAVLAAVLSSFPTGER